VLTYICILLCMRLFLNFRWSYALYQETFGPIAEKLAGVQIVLGGEALMSS